jgi:hypothetical protein
MICYYKDFEIEVANESDYTPGSADNVRSYNILHTNNTDIYTATAKHGIIVRKDEIEVANAIVIGTGGATGVYENSYLVKNDAIQICCANLIYSLNIPDLSLKWTAEPDIATCFSIYNFQDDFIIHGEIEISRLTEKGIILWTFSGRDIFVNVNGKKEFEIIGDTIRLVDFQDYEYVLDANGKELA